MACGRTVGGERHLVQEQWSEAMLGLMQNSPLLISSVLEHVLACHPAAQIASCTVEGSMHHCTYADIGRRAKQMTH